MNDYTRLKVKLKALTVDFLLNNAANKMWYITHGERLRIYPLILDFKAAMLAAEVETSIAKSMVSYMLGLR